ncbi:hypothetical protein [Aphanothece sacrum]|uniref:Ice-binding protein C-terminal domain-containing protein n=1 Tax=Aphanothece sacrum FPU1 TaxID=1920663 RepID=A0A401IK53_APHSA|nr:hypothetical protein [Aphanothece sacrum]GBF81673.1 hypothetical protein AsFPU1_3091 [Aphanothece sacrum FPU1]GBF84068.1 hypothetical protein AsFPU3_1114 [Aphanothece sacrum FPU3]
MKKSLIITLGSFFVLSGAMKIEVIQGATIENSFGLNNPQKTITFDDPIFDDGNLLTNEYANFGLEFDPGLFFIFPLPSNPPLPNLGLGGVTNSSILSEFSLKFLEDQTSAAFSMSTAPTISNFTALLNGSVVESFQAMTDFTQTNNFFGFKDILFNEIRINFANNNQTIPNAIIGEVQFGNSVEPPLEVPEPSSVMSLLVIGLFGIHATRKS